MRISRSKALVTAGAVAVLLLAGCAESQRDDDDATVDTDATLIFGAEGMVLSLDATWTSDSISSRVNGQMYETLVTLAPGTADIVGGLAESWEPDETGTVWTFHLRDGVTFHDGTEFNGEAVCFNYDRWHNLPQGVAQSPDVSYYWQQLSGGFADNEPDRPDLSDEPLYVSCEAPDPLTAVITIREPSATFPGITVRQQFGIHSPTALQQYDADNIGGTPAAPEFPVYAEEHPTGTGPFMFESMDRANGEVSLVRNDNYWGEKATIGRVIFRAIPDENARRQALLSGEIHAYDQPNAADWAALEAEGMQLEIRDAMNLLYIAFTQDHNPDLEDVRVRQAIAHALNRQAMVDAIMPEGAEVATQFGPPLLDGWNPDVPAYAYDPDRARDLLAQAGYDEGELELDFWWPADVTRPYMPDPQSIFELFKADLEAAGIVVNETSVPWTPEYLSAVQNGQADLHFLGWTADYPDMINFIATWFSRPLAQWGFDNQSLFDGLAEADAEPDTATRNAMYEELNAEIMEYLPGVPISHTPVAIVFGPNVTGVAASPLLDEDFSTAQVTTG
jgi:peptide/nickel transport system substrate-binding protein